MPVLCSNVCDNPSIVKDSINGYLFNPHNPEDIAESLIKMYTTSRSKLYEMGEESRKIIVEQYSIESYKNKYLNLIS
jgi:glycosyltransferase involved in cell wall biosynthesis